MFQYYFIFHSVTSAQKAFFYLQNKGLQVSLSSTPGMYASKGCTYAVRIRGADAYFVSRELQNSGIKYQSVLRTKGSGNFEEVVL